MSCGLSGREDPDALEAAVFSGDEATTHCHDGKKTNLSQVRAFPCISMDIVRKVTSKVYRPDMLAKLSVDWIKRDRMAKTHLGPWMI